MTDARTQRSKDAIHAAFFEMVLSQPFDAITIEAVIEKSGVARSTFYQHFSNKDALLASSLSGPFGVLVSCASESCDLERLGSLLEHFWQNRNATRVILNGEVRRKVTEALARMLEAQWQQQKVRLHTPTEIASLALADLILSSINAWLQGRATCAATQLAVSLHGAASKAFR